MRPDFAVYEINRELYEDFGSPDTIVGTLKTVITGKIAKLWPTLLTTKTRICQKPHWKNFYRVTMHKVLNFWTRS